MAHNTKEEADYQLELSKLKRYKLSLPVNMKKFTSLNKGNCVLSGAVPECGLLGALQWMCPALGLLPADVEKSTSTLN